MRIAAIVNDNVISVYDLDNRVRLIFADAGLDENPEAATQIRPGVLQNMIREQLQIEEAARLGITVTNQSITATLASLAKGADMTLEELDKLFQERNIDKQAPRRQIRARISWSGIVDEVLRERISIGEDDVDREIARLATLKGKARMRLSEIFLSVRYTREAAQVRRSAERIFQQLGQGARFSSLAREFSQSASAALGGNIGYVAAGELSPGIEEVLDRLKPGHVSPPIRSLAGYHIYLLHSRRPGGTETPQDLTITYRQLFYSLPFSAPKAEFEALRESIKETRTEINRCEDVVPVGRKSGGEGMEVLQEVMASQVAPTIWEILSGLDPHEPSKPVRMENGFLLVTVCSRSDGVGGSNRMAVTERLKRVALDALARRYMEDLRRQAFVDIRL